MPFYTKIDSRRFKKYRLYGAPYSMDELRGQNSLYKGLLFYYKLSDVNDSSPNKLNLTNNGTVSFSAGKVGNAAVFDGLGTNTLSRTLSGASDILNPTVNDFSVGCWLNLADNTVLRNAVAINGGYRIGYINTTNNIRFSIAATNLDNFTPTLATWYHCVLTYDKTNTKGTAYVNGTSIGNISSNTIFTGNPLYIGARDAANLWNGSVDEVFLYNRILSNQEILNYYNLGNGITLF